MKIEQVRLKRTLKAGSQVWVEGSYFPNDQYPSIPPEILLEVSLGTGTVEVTKKSKETVILTPKKSSPKRTSTSADVKTKTSSRDELEKALIEEKRVVEAVELPKRKSKLVRRK